MGRGCLNWRFQQGRKNKGTNNKAGVTDIGAQIEMVKEISAQDGMWYISDDKNKGELFA